MNAGLIEPRHLGRQKTRRLHGSLVAIVKIAGYHKRIDTLGKAVDFIAERA